MKKDEFLERLTYLLSDLDEAERDEAMAYYQDYLEEAGPEHEAEAVARFGSPERVAAEIRAGVTGEADGGEFTESGYRDERFEERPKAPDQYAQVARVEPSSRAEGWQEERKEARGEASWEGQARQTWQKMRESEFGRRAKSAWSDARDSEWGRKAQTAWEKAGHQSTSGRQSGEYGTAYPVRRRKYPAVLLIVAVLFCAGFGVSLVRLLLGAGFSIIGALFGAVFGILTGLLGLVAGGIASAAGLLFSGLGLIAAGIGSLVSLSAPASGLMLIGAGFLAVAGGTLCLALVKWGITTAIPGVFRGIRYVVLAVTGWVKRLFGRGGGEE